MMKKVFSTCLTIIALLICSVAFADDLEFIKKDAYLFYDVPDQILMCQNKKEDMIKGAKEFEETLTDHYSERFNVIGLERVSMKKEESNGKFNDQQKKDMFNKANKAVAIIVELRLMGNGTATDTYQNMFGAKKTITVPTTKINYAEYFGIPEENVFLEYDYGTFDYRANTFAMGGNLWTKQMDARVLTKNCVKWIIRDRNKFNPPNKYTYPESYERYITIYTGDISKMRTEFLKN